MPRLASEEGTKGMLTYGHCQVLIHPLAISRQKLWSLPRPWRTPAVPPSVITQVALFGERHITVAINGYFEG